MDINLPGFIPAILPVVLSPGASFTLAMNSALSGGRRGLVATLTGTALGIYTHALLIGLGITSLLVASPGFFSLLKVAGMLYMLWLGGQLIRSGLNAGSLTFGRNGPEVSVKAAYLANVLNPKAILLYLTVVSQFAGKQGEVSHYLLLASVHIIIMTIWLCAASRLLLYSAVNRDTRLLKKIIDTGGGLALILFALLNAFS